LQINVIFIYSIDKIIFIGDISETSSGRLQDDVTEAKWFSPDEIYAMDNKTLRDLDIKQMMFYRRN
jgi:hypothetical protein